MSGKKKLTQSEFISLVKEKHSHREYDYITTIYVNRRTKVKIICLTHGEFFRFPEELLSGKGCSKCSPRKYKPGIRKGQGKGKPQTKEHINARFANMNWKKGHIAHNRMTTDIFNEKIRFNWPECPYDLSKVEYVKNDVKITLVCHVHGDFLKWPSDVLNHSGCAKCAGQIYDTAEIIDKLTQMFPNYDYSNSVYVKSTAPMEVRCKIHESIFYQSHYYKNECPECSRDRRLKERIAAGRAKDPETMSEYEKYKKSVWRETNKSYSEHKQMLGERSRDKHLDHIYSILHGFRDGIDPIILGSIVNLRIIDSRMNQSKSMNCDYTKDELMKLYEENVK